MTHEIHRREPQGCRLRLVSLTALTLSLALGAAGCIGSQSTPCGGTVCPKGAVCYEGFDPPRCALPTEINACQGKVDGEGCDTGDGVSGRHCLQGLCLVGECGDGILDLGEDCDCGRDAATLASGCSEPNSEAPGASCRTNCRPGRCGDGVVDTQAGEVCDDGNTVGGDGCSPSCGSRERCGNGIVDVDAGESCDCGDGVIPVPARCSGPNGDPVGRCTSDCRSIVCGDGVVDQGEECDDGGGNSDTTPDACRTNCRRPFCGDGVADAGEVCDDANSVLGDGCSPDCASNETCGNGYLDFIRGETCDDGGLQNHDGCASTCRRETLGWTLAVPDGGSAPGNRSAHSMVYDAARGVIVMFGGLVTGPTDETWEWDGRTWTERFPPTRAPARADAAMAYDAARGVVVLFGGFGSTNDALGDTWEWDGGDWRRRAIANAPAPRGDHAMAYDSARGVSVLFGGRDSLSQPNRLADTWQWDGIAWTVRTPASAPSPRSKHTMAYDPARNVMVLFGGNTGSAGLDDTWEYDGTTWTERSPGTRPPTRYAHTMTYDTAHGVMLMMGGWGGASNLSDTWQYDGSTWTELTPTTTVPSGRNLAALAYDPARARGVLFGGGSASTLEWDGADWIIATPAFASPGLRNYRAMTYDRGRGVAVLFGGETGGTYPEDTWEWDGKAWRQVTTVGPSGGRVSHAMAYDAQREVVVLFGGAIVASGLQNDTWEWDGTAWTAITTTTQPSVRARHALAYDAARGVVLLFGGWPGAGELADTWHWDGTDWTALAPAAAPPGRFHHAMVYDEARRVVTLFGGEDATGGSTWLQDTWEWDGTTWTERLPTARPFIRALHGMAYDPRRRVVVLYGGFEDVFSPTHYGDTWEWDGNDWTQVLPATVPLARRARGAIVYDRRLAGVFLYGGDRSNTAFGDAWLYRADGPTPAETCVGLDGDGDGLVGCADDDCRPRCAPLCPSGASCNLAAPRCGDGNCSPLESCRLCPADCGPCAVVCGDLRCDAGEDATTCPGDCARCGDGVRERNEECDDGNTTAGDGCSPGCQSECGDGAVTAPEGCDDGNRVSGDGCSSTCTVEP